MKSGVDSHEKKKTRGRYTAAILLDIGVPRAPNINLFPFSAPQTKITNRTRFYESIKFSSQCQEMDNF
jgi:hypothetical protein